MADTAKAKFDAAVKVIRGLPKNGTFQPSHELMLKFYGYYKQSTEGPCKQSKPGFWDVVNKAKWEAWNKLGDMPREEAMLKYVEELKTIIETMPQTKQVGDFIDTIGNFYEVVEDEKNGKRITENGDHDDEDEVVAESNISLNNGLDQNFNHSAAVEEILRKCESMENEEKGQITVTEKISHHEQIFVKKSSAEKGEMKKINGRMKDEVGLSESDSDEFCDTSDEPIQDAVMNGRELTALDTSTPISKTENRVRFSNVNSIPTDALIHQTTPSTRSVNSRDLRLGLLSNSVPFSSKSKPETPLSDSLYVNMESNDSLNLSTDSQLGISLHYPDNSVLQPNLKQSEGNYVATRGGGNIPKGQGSFPVSSDSTSSGTGGRGNSGNTSGSRRGLFAPGSSGSGEDEEDVYRGRRYGDINEQIAVALVRLQQDMNGVLSRLTNLEAIAERQNQERAVLLAKKKNFSWWPFDNLSKRTAVFIILWPFLAHFIINIVCRSKRRR